MANCFSCEKISINICKYHSNDEGDRSYAKYTGDVNNKIRIFKEGKHETNLKLKNVQI